ncbi:hypothetical protein SETIT_8G083500v2 [Setaria italica]|uniref:PAS domain-containing protein n=1 Tax=Setaria italica TaxID=4555 RepID=K3ZL71_SETIT|nr:hypothetical protein SETIT_8G083500v2 [Setaria italica]
MAVVVNEDGEIFEVATGEQTHKNQRKKLRGLIVCHHGSPRYVPFPLRHACEFIGQVFSVHISKEIELEKKMQEKTCPLSIISGSPNIMDLVKCDGAALLYGDKVWQLHTTPTVTQIRDIATWLSDVHRDSTSLSFDSLRDAAYPGLASLGDMICGMAMAKATSSIILFWFRSHAAAEIKWGGAKHNPSDKDDCRRMQPRLSFKAFLEVVRMKSLPWNDYEMDAINSLQLVVRGSLKEENKLARVPHFNNPINHLKPNAFSVVQAETTEVVLLMETETVPIMAVDGNGFIIGWNLKAAQMTGFSVHEATSRHMLTLVEESSLPNVQKVLSLALRGIEEKKKGEGPLIMVVNARTNRDLQGKVVGVSFVAQDMNACKFSSEKITQSDGENKVLVNDLNLFTPMFGADKSGKCNEWNAAMEKLTGLHREEVLHKMLLEEVFDSSNAPCMLKDKNAYVGSCIIINSILASDQIENQVPFGLFDRNGWYIECLLSAKRKENADGVLIGVSFFILFPNHELQHALQMDEFVLQDMVVAAVSKVQTACRGKGIIVSCDLAEKFLRQRLYGDCIRLRKILSDFLFAWVKIKQRLIVVPEEILAHMFQEDHEDQPEEGLTLVVCRNLLSMIN